MHLGLPNKTLHRSAICAWGFALEFFFISQLVAVGELTSEVIRQWFFWFFSRGFSTGFCPAPPGQRAPLQDCRFSATRLHRFSLHRVCGPASNARSPAAT